MSSNPLSASLLKTFEKSYDPDREARAEQSRGEFLESFPIRRLNRLKMDDYVIGLQRPTFCDRVEVKTRPWAVIQGSTAIKFGIYFGATKSDSSKQYRFAKKFGDDTTTAFRAVRAALVSLVRLGNDEQLDFAKIDANPLSQMFKAKILSLYFPNKFINACSAEHLQVIGEALGFDPDLPASQYQHLIVQAKNINVTTRAWSNPKFTAFLYRTIVRTESVPGSTIHKPAKKSHRRVNFEDIQDQRDRIGKMAEEFAMTWERQRLEGANLSDLIPAIEDRREQPGYGYDFMSHTDLGRPRYIEVKSVGQIRGDSYRFFLSENERSTSEAAEYGDDYFFYLVFFDGNGAPLQLKSILAKQMYQHAEILPASYTVRFDIEHV
jgi:hypothetical protein